MWDCNTLEFIASLDQHKSAVCSMVCSEDQTVMVSAGQDCRIIVWDLLSEESSIMYTNVRCRKDAHKSPITQIELLTLMNTNTYIQEQLIVSCGRDGFVKAWNLKTLQLLDVFASLSNEVCCMAYNPELNLLYVGSNREEIGIVKIEAFRDEDSRITRYFQEVGRFKRNSFARPLQMVLDKSRLHLLNSDKTIESYIVLDEREFARRKKRLAKRRKGK